MPPGSMQQSFIAHEEPQGRRRVAAGMADLLVLISMVLLVASCVLAGGVVMYKQYEQTSIDSKLDQLKRAKAAFEPALVQKLTRLDDRMRIASDLLSHHAAPSLLFDMLEKTTIKNIAFDTLDLSGNDKGDYSVAMSGVAESVNAIALEADLISKGGMIASPIFSDINRVLEGVHFSVAGTIPLTSLTYAQLINVDGSMAAPSATLPESPAQGAPAPAAPAKPDPFGGAPAQE